MDIDIDSAETQIAYFIQSQNVGEKTKTKMAARLKDSINFMAGLGVGIFDTPSQAHYGRLNEHLHTLTQPKGKHKGQPYSESVIKDWQKLTEKFYRWNGNSSADSQISIQDFESAAVPDNKNSTEEPEQKRPNGGEDSPSACQQQEETFDAPTGGENDADETQYTQHSVDTSTGDEALPLRNFTLGSAVDTPTGGEETITNNTEGEKTMTDTQTINSENSTITAQHPQSTVDAVRKAGRPETTGRSEKFTLYMTPALWKKIRMLADLDEDNITDFLNNVLEDYCDNERQDDLDFLYTLERKKEERRLKKAAG